MALGVLGFIFGMSCRVGYGYWPRGSGPWAVRASKKSARAISTSFEPYYLDPDPVGNLLGSDPKKIR